MWPMYLKHRGEMEDIIWEIVYLDGVKSEENLFSQVYEYLRQELAKQKCRQVHLCTYKRVSTLSSDCYLQSRTTVVYCLSLTVVPKKPFENFITYITAQ